MLTEALIEREIRTSMKTEGLAGIPLYPELRNCPAPSAPRILEIFDDVQRHQLISQDQIVQTFEPQLTPLQQQVLDLLHIPASVYTSAASVSVSPVRWPPQRPPQPFPAGTPAPTALPRSGLGDRPRPALPAVPHDPCTQTTPM